MYDPEAKTLEIMELCDLWRGEVEIATALREAYMAGFEAGFNDGQNFAFESSKP